MAHLLHRCLAGMLAFLPAAANAADTIDGCWRAQQMRIYHADKAPLDQGTDCVTEYAAGQATVRCNTTRGDTVYAYKEVRPGRLHVTMAKPMTGMALAAPLELDYRIDGDWLITSRTYDPNSPPGNSPSHPTRFEALAVRSNAQHDGAAACKPRGDTGLRIGTSRFSSLALTVPKGWTPELVDPATNAKVGEAVNMNFFVGAFVPKSPVAGQPRSVFVTDDYRYGPKPIRASDFVAVKTRFFAETQGTKKMCDLPDRACVLLKEGAGLVYTELFNVRGRVAAVTVGADSSSDSVTKKMVEAAREFTDSLQKNNP
jgi:hypothetical protein